MTTNFGHLASPADPFAERTDHACPLLIVEDDPDFLDLLTMRFSRVGFAVTPVAHPRQALEAASATEFTVALLDCTLPEQDGIRLMQALRSRRPELQAVLLSGHADPGIEEEASRRGAFAWLRKPSRLSDIEAAVRRAADCGSRLEDGG